MKNNKKALGLTMVITACTFWGISGLFAKALFNISTSITSLWLTQWRLILGGAIMVLISWLHGDHPFHVFRNLHDTWVIFAYGVIGLVPVQFAYFMAVQKGNASIATVLQFLGPFFIIAYLAAFRHEPHRTGTGISSDRLGTSFCWHCITCYSPSTTPYSKRIWCMDLLYRDSNYRNNHSILSC